MPNSKNPIVQELVDHPIYDRAGTEPANPSDFPDDMHSEPNMALDDVQSSDCYHVLGVDDVSVSMEELGKIGTANASRVKMYEQLAVEETADCIFVSQITFNHEAKVAQKMCKASEISPNPLKASGNTSIDAALIASIKLLKEATAFDFGVDRSLKEQFVVLTSDGQSPVSNNLIQQVKALATVICVGFGEDADMALLGKIATSGKAYFASTDGDELIELLAKIGAKVSEKAQGYDVDEI